EQVYDCLALQGSARAHRLRGRELEAASEHGEAAKQQLLLVEQQIMAPLQGGREGLLPRRRRAAARAPQREAVVEALGERARSEGPESGRRELEGPPQAILTGAN